MVSEYDVAELERRLRLLENRVGQWALNGLDSFDGLNALEFGDGLMRISPDGIQIKSATTDAQFPIIGRPGIVGVGARLYNGFTVSGSRNLGWVAFTIDDTNSTARSDLVAYADGGSHAGAVYAHATTADHWVDFAAQHIIIPSGTADPTGGGVASGSFAYRSDTGHFRGREGVQWVDFATMGAVARGLPEPVWLLASSNTSVNNKSSLAETTFISQSIPAYTIQSAGNVARAVRVRSGGKYINNSGSGRTARLRVKFGGTTYWDDTTASIGASATEAAWMFDCTLAGLSGSDSTQTMFGRFTLGAQAAATTGWGDLATVDQVSTTFYGEPTKDSTADQTFAFTILNSASDANLGFTQTFYSVEVI